jgi:hypothetical protein
MTAQDDVAAIKSEYWYLVLQSMNGETRANQILITRVEAEIVRRAEHRLQKHLLTGPDIDNPLKTDQELIDILIELRAQEQV